jgi:hypothetical protein
MAEIRKYHHSYQDFFPLFLSLTASTWLVTTTLGLTMSSRTIRDQSGAVKQPNKGGGFGGVGAEERRESHGFWEIPRWSKLILGDSKMIQSYINLNPTVQIWRWSDQWSWLHRFEFHFFKIISLISKLPKIKTNSSCLRKILWKFLHTRCDMYFDIESSN